MTARTRVPARKPAPKRSAHVGGRDRGLYTLQVCLISGPMGKAFVRKNRVVSRTIQIRGDQTLDDLHGAIFTAFDREDEHLYEFQIGGKRTMDPNARLYDHPMAAENASPFDKIPADASRTSIGSLGLTVADTFAYWFDFGDDWWHQIDVLSIEEKSPAGKWPKVIKRVGASPPQYPE